MNVNKLESVDLDLSDEERFVRVKVVYFQPFFESSIICINSYLLLNIRANMAPFEDQQGGHGTGKTGNLVLTFSRQGKHREFCFDTGKNFETQGKYFSVTQGKI